MLEADSLPGSRRDRGCDGTDAADAGAEAPAYVRCSCRLTFFVGYRKPFPGEPIACRVVSKQALPEVSTFQFDRTGRRRIEWPVLRTLGGSRTPVCLFVVFVALVVGAVGAAPAVAGAASAASAAIIAARRNMGMRARSSIAPGIGAKACSLEERWSEKLLSPRR